MFSGVLKAYEGKVSDSWNILMYGSKWLWIDENVGVVKQQRKLLIVKEKHPSRSESDVKTLKTERS